MSFASQTWLLTLLAIPLLVLCARLLRRRGTRYAVRLPATASLARAAALSRSRWDHLPAVLLLCALLLIGLATGRPERMIKVPIEGTTIMLVTDHSGSMAATDVEPNRLAATTKAATSLLDETPASTRVGLVTYSDGPDQTVAPTTEREPVLQALNAQSAFGATATGSALQVAVETIRQQRTEQVSKRPPAAIILLSDGRTTTGSDPIIAAEAARSARIPIFTVSLGEPDATIPNPRFPGSGDMPVPPDPETLAQIASVSGGKAFTTANAKRLNSIYKELGTSLASKREPREITLWFVGGGIVLLLAAGAAALRIRGPFPA